jgi:drug/metabolite transporter (DMT)-like permease
VSLLEFTIVVTLGCWSVWGIIDKKALEASTHAGVLVRLYSMALLQVPLLYLALKLTQPSFAISGGAWYWTGIAAVFQLFSLASYLVAMTITDASLVLGATAAYPVVTQFLAVMFLGEKLDPLRTVGSAAIACGVIAIGMSQNESHHKLTGKQKLFLTFAILFAMFGWGIWGIFDKKAIAFGTPIEIWLAESLWECLMMVLCFVVARAVRYEIELKNKRAWWLSFVSAVTLGIGRLTFLYALKDAPASYVIAITGCYPLFMYLLAMWLLKEKFSKVRFAGILMIVLGGAAVQLSL